jgi:bifunctional oligoribonuclease and PAP phosphatase NrnA
MRRVNAAVREVLSETVGELKDPRIGFVTVTGVETSPDLRTARVYVSVLGSEKKRENTLAGLEAAHGVLQARIARELRMKRTPQLTFEYDDSVERGVRISQLIDELAPDDPDTSDLDAVVDALRRRDRFLLITHENPDGDALGSILAAKLVLQRLGKDVMMYLSGVAPLPAEYKFMPLEDLRRELPDDVEERVLFALDCANESRLGEGQAALESAQTVVNVDHHHDNSRFGQVNLVLPEASSTGEIVRDLARELGVELTPDLAEALYVALVTDTGRFQYANTTPKALRLAAELVEAGADVHRVFQSVYETVQLAKLKLLARALERAQVYEGGGLVVSYLLRTDFGEVGAAEPYSEGIIDFLRAVEGAEMAALIREPPAPGRPARRVSLRSSSDELDVSAIARASGSGGGHRQAAGFSSELEIPKIVEFLREQYLEARAAARA